MLTLSNVLEELSVAQMSRVVDAEIVVGGLTKKNQGRKKKRRPKTPTTSTTGGAGTTIV